MNQIRLHSPDKTIQVDFAVQQYQDGPGCMVYRMRYRDEALLDWSPLGFVFENAPPLQQNLVITGVDQHHHSQVWEPTWGEYAAMSDHHIEYVIHLKEDNDASRQLDVVFRLYNEGVAFRYVLQKSAGFENAVISQERTHFSFFRDHTVYAVNTAQGRYQETSLSKIEPGVERPLVVKVSDDGPYAAIAEAALVDYARMKLSYAGDHVLVSHLTGKPLYCFQEETALKDVPEDSLPKVKAPTPLQTPWRVILAADTPAALYHCNSMILNLNEPCAIPDTSWIRPGKVIREVTLTTQGGMACVDFAVAHNLQYIEFDAGWYGHEYDFASDARSVSIDPGRYNGPLDLPKVVEYANQHNIGVMLYINHRAMVQQLDELLPLFKQWGIRGLKYGFVEVGTQRWTSWLHDCVRKAAEYGFVLTIHDEYRPTGYQRTYPNLLTQEGICGDEEIQPARNTLTTVFTRMLAGPGDHTVCYYNERVDEHWSHAYQLAKAVVIFSPLQFLYWYDRPIGSFGTTPGVYGPGIIGEEPELEFFDHLVTVWDDTLVLDGEIGQHITMARRTEDTWFVGAMNGESERVFAIEFSFLDPSKEYTAYIYTDDETVPTRTKVRVQQETVTHSSTLQRTVKPHHGLACRIVPNDEYPIDPITKL